MRTARTRFRRAAATLAILAAAVASSGCLPPSSPLHARIEVRNATTGQPVPHATVRWTGGNVFIPPRDVLGPPISPPATPPGGRTETDAGGDAELTLAGNRPNDLIVRADGYRTLHVVLTAGKQSIGGAATWTAGIVSPGAAGAEATMEVRVLPAQ